MNVFLIKILSAINGILAAVAIMIGGFVGFLGTGATITGLITGLLGGLTIAAFGCGLIALQLDIRRQLLVIADNTGQLSKPTVSRYEEGAIKTRIDDINNNTRIVMDKGGHLHCGSEAGPLVE